MVLTHWVRLRAKQAFYLVLSRLYGFDAWHWRVIRENCGYFRQLKTLHESIGSAVTVDIGCGLGEIVAGLSSEVRIGIDRDPAVIRAARMLRGKAVRFLSLGEELRAAACAAGQGRGCLLFLNWLHAISAEEARRDVGDYIRRFRPAHVIFDVIDRAVANYRYKHDPELFCEFGKIVTAVEAGDHIRILVLLEVVEPVSGWAR